MPNDIKKWRKKDMHYVEIQFGWSLNKGSLNREVLRIKFMVDSIIFLFVTG